MNEISINSILQWLEKKNYDFSSKGTSLRSVTPASVFEIIDNGFYFIKEGLPPKDISNSCILTSSEYVTEQYEQLNYIIQINIDEQAIYYELIRDFFQPKSTSIVSKTAVISPEANIGVGTQIDDFTVIGNAQIGKGCIIKSHCHIGDGVIIGDFVVIEPSSIIGTNGVVWAWNYSQTERIRMPQLGGVQICNNVVLSANTIITRGSLNESSIIGENSFLAPGCRLGHGTQIGAYAHLSNNVVTAGNVSIGDNTFIGSGAIFQPRVKVDSDTVVGAGAVVNKSTSGPGLTLVGVPAKERKTNSVPNGMPKFIRKNT
jgi:UDP-3-O-[3-hydroxymyristoyl] glucosamine N-acyltransferase